MSANSPLRYDRLGRVIGVTKEHEDWKRRKNLDYLRAILNADNERMIRQLVESMSHWADGHELPLEAVKTVSPATWTQDGRIVISFIKDPEWE